MFLWVKVCYGEITNRCVCWHDCVLIAGMAAGMIGGMAAGMIGGMIAGIVAGMVAGMIGGMVAGMVAGMVVGGMIAGGMQCPSFLLVGSPVGVDSGHVASSTRDRRAASGGNAGHGCGAHARSQWPSNEHALLLTHTCPASRPATLTRYLAPIASLIVALRQDPASFKNGSSPSRVAPPCSTPLISSLLTAYHSSLSHSSTTKRQIYCRCTP